MSAKMPEIAEEPRLLPLVNMGGADRTLAFREGCAISVTSFLADVTATALELGPQPYAINLCEDRYDFMVGFCAAATSGKTTLLPQSRARNVVAETIARFPRHRLLVDRLDATHDSAALRVVRADSPAPGTCISPMIDAAHAVAIGFTSGSTGEPRANIKTWGGFHGSSARNVALLAGIAGHVPGVHIVATVPPQHMYGMELSVLVPLLGPFAVHAARPFFPADIARALHELPAPRLLVTTPVHLRALLALPVELPSLCGIVLATAALPIELAHAAERAYAAPVLEMFGATETCVFAHRAPTRDEAFSLYEGVQLEPRAEGAWVDAPWFEQPKVLQDVIELLPGRRFALRGRHADLLEIAGKRASLGELTQRVLGLPGVRDAVVFQCDPLESSGIGRIAALVVAPGCTEAGLLQALRPLIDPVFLPRPLRRVEALPRNETGKLTRSALISLLAT